MSLQQTLPDVGGDDGRGTIEYKLRDMTEWSDVTADVIITDPPFGIDFDGKKSNYHRDESNVVDGYVEWGEEQYSSKLTELLTTIQQNLASDGQALIFSGWNNSPHVHRACADSNLTLEGKLYWEYNFAPYCTRRPAHNVYEIYWVVGEERHYYDNECSYDHCTDGEANLSALTIPRDYHQNLPTYPTRLPTELIGVLLEHFSTGGDTVFDPLAGSGVVGCVAASKNRDAVCGDLNAEALEVFQSLITKMFD
jgi:site-specific DNA-methyltransferase (adenine-specific)